jgi:transposase
MIKANKEQLTEVKKVVTDGGYIGKEFASQVRENIEGAEIEVIKRIEVHSFKVLPKRWIVERSFSWLEKCRRLWKNCERRLETSLQMVVLAFLRICLQRF